MDKQFFKDMAWIVLPMTLVLIALYVTVYMTYWIVTGVPL